MYENNQPINGFDFKFWLYYFFELGIFRRLSRYAKPIFGERIK